MNISNKMPGGVIVPQDKIIGYYYGNPIYDPYEIGSSGSSYIIDNAQSKPSMDLSTIVCNYCRSRYLAETIKSLKITNCLGCGSASFHFERQ